MKTSYCAGSSLLQDVKGPVHRSRRVSERFDELKMIVGTSQSQKQPGRILHMNNGLQQSSRNVENQCQDELKLFCLHLSFPNTKKIQIQLFAQHCIVSERLKQKDSDKRIQGKAKYCRWSHQCMQASELYPTNTRAERIEGDTGLPQLGLPASVTVPRGKMRKRWQLGS